MTPSTYYANKRREREPSARELRDAVMLQVLFALWMTNRKVYWAHKLWKAARRAGHDIGRDQVARLMRVAGIHGVTRRCRVFTTRPDPDARRAADLVKRHFSASRPRWCWTVRSGNPVRCTSWPEVSTSWVPSSARTTSSTGLSPWCIAVAWELEADGGNGGVGSAQASSRDGTAIDMGLWDMSCVPTAGSVARTEHETSIRLGSQGVCEDFSRR
ncbi:MAG: IS3 family transposase [Acidimicrobiaceae bacterium]|nr:IS3 family transposase [Acidimicrobiaceae bacterium]